ncbi:DEAD/DEAH box helicase domain-containing protein [Besnoitia besnoiti]|uniref:ATP-dependent RNA helicase n=1 Tax=Besnoitia besnoiti TaxID=94643 RepID=A0A2A9M7V4_BESBE|nr:DEAD/DEAH box helicase domain-containing protein [Besnoitia besnoiti]PFH31470.1 DEAD/DEAH box helicase domain-containing protein [Besnoitia besnoiti]
MRDSSRSGLRVPCCLADQEASRSATRGSEADAPSKPTSSSRPSAGCCAATPSFQTRAAPSLRRGGKTERRKQAGGRRQEVFHRGSRSAHHAGGAASRTPARQVKAEDDSEVMEEAAYRDAEEDSGPDQQTEGDGDGEEDAEGDEDEDREDAPEDDGSEGGPDAESEEAGDDDAEIDYHDSSLFSVSSYAEMEGLLHTRLVRTLNHHGFRRLTAIQHLAIPTVLHGHDTLVQCFTGSGKTLCFAVPLLQQLLAQHERSGKNLKRSDGTRGLLLMPTRELALQACSQISRLAQLFPWIVVASITGGEKKQSEKRRLRAGVSILLCTPGRLLDHLTTTSCFQVSCLHLLVLDEADRLLDMGFEAKLKKIVTLLREKKAEQLEMRAMREEVLAEQRERAHRASRDDDDDEQEEERHAEARETAEVAAVSPKARVSHAAPASGSAARSDEAGFQVIMASATLTPQVQRLAAFCLQQAPQWVSLDRCHSSLRAHLEANQAGSPARRADAAPHAAASLSAFPCCCSLSASNAVSAEAGKAASDEETGDEASGAEVRGEATRFHVPSQLRQYYLQVSSPRMRLLPLLALLLQVAKSGRGKAVVFLSCCDAVEYFHTLLQRMQWPGPVLDREQKQRQKERLALMRKLQGGKGKRRAIARAVRGFEKEQKKMKKRRKRQQQSGDEDGAAYRDDDSDEEEDEEDSESADDEAADEGDDELWGDYILRGVSLFKLHGQMGRDDRIGYLKEFSDADGAAVLFATDVAARGLNLPHVNWIAQFDLPQQVEEYVHRIGRTARLGKEGNALIFLLDCEKGYVDYLQMRGFSNIQEMDESRMLDTLFTAHMPEYLRHLDNPASFLIKQFSLFVADRPSLLQTARKAFLGTLRAFRCLGKEIKAVCSHATLHTGHLASSFGLNEAPREAAMRLRSNAPAAESSDAKGASSKTHALTSGRHEKGGRGDFGKTSSRFSSQDKRSKKPVPPTHGKDRKAAGRAKGRADDEKIEIEEVQGGVAFGAKPNRTKPGRQEKEGDKHKSKDSDALRAAARLREKGDLLVLSNKDKKEKRGFAFPLGADRKRQRDDGEAAARKKSRVGELFRRRKTSGFAGKPGGAHRRTDDRGNQTFGGPDRRMKHLSQSEFSA